MSPGARPPRRPLLDRLRALAARKPDPAEAADASAINIALADLIGIDGAMAAAVVDGSNGTLLGATGSGLDLHVAASGNAEMVRAKLATVAALGLAETLDDILITLSSQHHIIRPLQSDPTVFIYLVLDRGTSNLALARRKVIEAEHRLVL